MLLRVAVTVTSLVLGVGAAVLALQVVGPDQAGFAEGTPSQLLAFLATLTVVGGITLIVGLTYVERSFQKKRKSRRRSR
jgi:uncharacterized membrane protein YidH (DUF202 family)